MTEILDRYPKEVYDRSRNSHDYNINILGPFGDLLLRSQETPMVLDLACGRGEAADYLEHTFGIQSVKIDLSKEGLNLTRGRRVRSFADKIPFADESFHAVHMKDAIVHIPDTSKLFQEVSRVLKARGKALIVSAYPDKFNSFYYKNEGSERSKWVNITDQSEYLRYAKSLLRDRNVSTISAPYYSESPARVEACAEGQGLYLERVSEWIPKDNSDWYNESPKPVNRYVMLFQKV